MDLLTPVFPAFAAAPPGVRPAVAPIVAPAAGLVAAALAAPALALGRQALLAQPQALHPALWRAHQLGRHREGTCATGFALLDAELPGGGWPHSALTELLLPHTGVGEMRLLAPALAALGGQSGGQSGGQGGGQGGPGSAHAGSRSILLFDPPALLCGWALAQLGVDARALIVIHGRAGPRQHSLVNPDLLWALEQALRSGHAAAVLAWLPARLRAEHLRRLQLAAQAHAGPVFVFSGIEARCKPSPAPLRLSLACAEPDVLAVRLLKRRGPQCGGVLHLELPAVLGAALREHLQAAPSGQRGPPGGEVAGVVRSHAP